MNGVSQTLPVAFEPMTLVPGKRDLLKITLLAGLYALSAKLGLAFAFVGANISPLWPPAGLAVAGLILGGLRLWPGVFLGAFAANAVISPLPLGTAGLISMGNGAEALVAAALLQKALQFNPAFERTRDTLAWVAIAGGLAPMVGATVGTLALTQAGLVPWPIFGSAWWTWWSGDAMGALVLAPTILVWWQRPWKAWTFEDHHAYHKVTMIVLLVSLLVFLSPIALEAKLSPLAFASLPPLIWSAYKLGAPGATLASFIACSVAIAGTATGRGAYSGFRDLNEQIGMLQGYLAVASISALGFASLVGERRRAEETSQRTEERFQLLVDEVKEYAILLLDAAGRVTTWNEGAERITGYRSEEILGEPISRFYTPEDVRDGKPARSLHEAAQAGRFSEEGWRVRKDGSRFYAHVVLTTLWDASGAPRGFVKITRDVTERRMLMEGMQAHQAELERIVGSRTSQLTHAQRTLRLVYDSVQEPMGLLTIESDGGFTIASCNKPMATLRGNHPRQLVGKRLEDVLSKDVAAIVLPVLRSVALSSEIQRKEWRLPTAAGERTFDVHLRPLVNEVDTCTQILVAGQDVTERLKAESSLRESQKLESLGVMAGGIAHDFNNLLSAVVGYANIGSGSLPPDSKALPLFKKIEQSALQAADLTRQLLAYSGRGQFLITDVDLNIVILEITQLLSVSIPKKADLRFGLHRPLPLIKGDATQIQQMMMNLVLNAAESLDACDDGVILIRTDVEYLGESDLKRLHPILRVRPGHYVSFEVVDSGCGMPPEMLERIFDPFFTTKFLGRGLGLSAMLGILRSHHGGIQIQSEVDRGSTLKIYLPVVSQFEADEGPPPNEEMKPETTTLLVVEDEPNLRDLTSQMAREVGFDVLQAEDGQQALELFRAHHGQLAMVFMDLTMPRMGGREAFLCMREIDPSVPVVLCSGYSEQDVRDLLSDHGLAGFLMKPFRFVEFKAALRQAERRPSHAMTLPG